MDEVMRKLRELRDSGPSSSGGSGQQESTQAPIYSGILPPTTTTTTQTSAPNHWDNIFRHLRPVIISQLPEEFECLKTLTFEEVTGTDDFPDDKLRGRKAMRLIPLEDNQVCRLGKDIFESINSISQYHIGVIFLLAFQLKNPEDGRTERMFPAFDELEIPEDIDFPLLNRSGMFDGGYATTIHESGEIYENAKAYSFLACSILKFSVRSAENFSNSLQHIQSGFRQFYARDFPLGGINIRRDTISTIHNHFSTSELLRNTLYRFLYNANHRGMVCGVQSFIYDTHLTYTGMHVVPISFKLCEAFQCSSGQFLAAIYAKRFEPQIRALETAFLLLGSKEERYRRQLWKYGRIFDHTFLLPLQTKRCPKFAFIFACILKNESPAANSRILEIKQFQEVNQRDRERLENGTRLHMAAFNNSLASKENYKLMTKLLDYLYN